MPGPEGAAKLKTVLVPMSALCIWPLPQLTTWVATPVWTWNSEESWTERTLTRLPPSSRMMEEF